jgi:mannose-6-phosphate isomerase-like protein (cupin superfamily)
VTDSTCFSQSHSGAIVAREEAATELRIIDAQVVRVEDHGQLAGTEPRRSARFDRRRTRRVAWSPISASALPYGLDTNGGERLRFSGAEVLVKASAESTGGAFSIVEEISPLDTPRHMHEREDEVFFVLEGEHVFEIGDEEFGIGPGGMAFGPRGVPHAQRRVVPRTGRTLTMCSPAGFEGFVRELAQAESSGGLGPEAYARVSERYRITWL